MLFIDKTLFSSYFYIMNDTKRKVGRPKLPIDYNTVEKLAEMFCTQDEIAAFLDISKRTLLRDKEFCQYYKKGNDNAKCSLRRKQFKLADTNAAMAIFLGKNYLGQRDVQNIEGNITQQITYQEKYKQVSTKTPDEVIAELTKEIQADS